MRNSQRGKMGLEDGGTGECDTRQPVPISLAHAFSGPTTHQVARINSTCSKESFASLQARVRQMESRSASIVSRMHCCRGDTSPSVRAGPTHRMQYAGMKSGVTGVL
jgi:hypothetical protein